MNGKSVFYKAIDYALGDYASIDEPDLFMHRDGAHPTGEMDLLGKRRVVVSENDEGRRLAEATMKRLTGGDPITARGMRQNFVTFDPSHTPMLITNHLPKVRGDDLAIWRRLRVIPFDVVIPEAERDPHLSEILRLDADAILTWAVTGYADYSRRGRLDEPPQVNVLRANTFESWSVTTTICFLSARSIPTIAFSTGTNSRSRASRALRLRSPRETPLPLFMNVLLMRWDTKPDKRIRGTFLRPDSHRRTPFYAAIRSDMPRSVRCLYGHASGTSAACAECPRRGPLGPRLYERRRSRGASSNQGGMPHGKKLALPPFPRRRLRSSGGPGRREEGIARSARTRKTAEGRPSLAVAGGH
jgi:hypothetical protein